MRFLHRVTYFYANMPLSEHPKWNYVCKNGIYPEKSFTIHTWPNSCDSTIGSF